MTILSNAHLSYTNIINLISYACGERSYRSKRIYLSHTEITEITEIIESGSFEVMLTELRPVLIIKAHDFPCVQAPR